MRTGSKLHESDGYIFTPKDDEYMPSTSDRVLKWKPSELITCDFGVKVLDEGDPDDGGGVVVLQLMAADE